MQNAFHTTFMIQKCAVLRLYILRTATLTMLFLFLVVSSAPPLPPICELEISIHYRRKEVQKKRVSASLVQLHYQQEMCDLNGQAVCFPSTEGLLDQKQIMYTKHLLQSIQKGLLLEVNNTGIYGTRLDVPCKVFASTSNPPENHAEEPRKLVQNVRELLLSFEKFGRGKGPPKHKSSSNVIYCF